MPPRLFPGLHAPIRPRSFRRVAPQALPFALLLRLSILLLSLLLLSPGGRIEARNEDDRIDDRIFWRMVSEFSEKDGYFHSDNFVSNEWSFQNVVPELKRGASRRGAYLGVGPDQNFTYLVALRPRIAFIIDIRRQNALLHLLYKALIEMSDDRVEFVSRLFSRPKPHGLDRRASVSAIFAAFAAAKPDPKYHEKNVNAVLKRLMDRHHFPLESDDVTGIKRVYQTFYETGPDISYSVPGQGDWGHFPSYAELLQATDDHGENHSYLASDDSYQALRQLQERNLVVPVVGDFAGDKAIRSIGRYLRTQGLPVLAFYTSNVEFYLFRTDRWKEFIANVATLPVNDRSTFIRASFHGLGYGYSYSSTAASNWPPSQTLLEPIADLVLAFNQSRIQGYQDVIERSK